MKKENTTYVIAISGGSGSGKSTVTRCLTEILGEDKVLVISQDDYYRDLSHLPFQERDNENFDDPASIDAELLKEQFTSLVKNESIEKPIYCFKTFTRKKQFKLLEPKKFIILEGIFSLCFEEIFPYIDLKLYVDVPDDLRFIRRLGRDVKSRGRSVEQVTHQYMKTVRPMHLKHIEPCRELADFVIPWIKYNNNILSGLVSYIRA